ncbi:hypothetical protein O3P69_015119 [Scylla paramamosain]|uniref:Uncharacterized protein n=1 Tax=Scylla paramamosain TaxID=85552 RepID=A0AAW0T3V8_SCYPA
MQRERPGSAALEEHWEKGEGREEGSQGQEQVGFSTLARPSLDSVMTLNLNYAERHSLQSPLAGSAAHLSTSLTKLHTSIYPPSPLPITASHFYRARQHTSARLPPAAATREATRTRREIGDEDDTRIEGHKNLKGIKTACRYLRQARETQHGGRGSSPPCLTCAGGDGQLFGLKKKISVRTLVRRRLGPGLAGLLARWLASWRAEEGKDGNRKHKQE